MSGRFYVYVPARYASTRLPGKPLLPIAGKPLVQHVVESAARSAAVSVCVATDSEEIASAAQSFVKVVMTSAQHQSGTDRVCEAAQSDGRLDDDVIVNVQGDEYSLPPALIDQVAQALVDNPDKPMATLCEPLRSVSEWLDPNVVKVLFDDRHDAIYFSRAPVPWTGASPDSAPTPAFRHIGIYAYRMASLKQFTSLPRCALEQTERLEQLRALHQGWRIHVEQACAPSGVGVDTAEDLERARKSATSNKLQVNNEK